MIRCLIFIIILTGWLFSQNGQDDSLATMMEEDSLYILPIPFRAKPQPPALNVTAFDVGEELTFKIRYGFIKAGNAQMKVVARKEMRGLPVYHIQTTASSVPFFDAFYKVRDEVNSFVTCDGFYSLRFEKKLREGDYYFDLFVDYFGEDSIAKVQTIRYEDDDLNIREKKTYDVKVPPFINDILSSFYYVRNLDLQVGNSVHISNHEKDKVYDLEVKVYRREDLDVDAGKFHCIVVEPLLRGDGIFKQEGRLTIWLTDDDRKIPVQMKTKIAVGSLTTELTKIEGANGPIDARIK